MIGGILVGGTGGNAPGNITVIKYRPHVDTGDPVRDDDPTDDHVYKGMKDEHLLKIFGSWKAPTYQDP